MALKIKRALLSVSNKIGIVKFAQTLQNFGVEIISTGGTYSQLSQSNINVRKVEDLTGFPEMMNGRLKTLHPLIHGAILADRSNESHMNDAEKAGMQLIDMVVVNLYPFRETVSKPGVTMEEAIENIDIGGPAMIRSAAKNHKNVAVVVDPEDYEKIADELLRKKGLLDDSTLSCLSVKAFQHTCEYDSIVFNYFINKYNDSKDTKYKGSNIYLRPYLKIDCTKSENEFRDNSGGFNEDLNLQLAKIQDLRYGENPHQKAAYYKFSDSGPDCFANSTQLQGKELSFNNILDGNAAFSIVKEFSSPCVAIIKHNNPCGVGIGNTTGEAYQNAHWGDPLSAFGGVIASNMKWTVDASKFLFDKFIEVLIAPDFEEEALKILQEKQNMRILKINFDLQSHLDKLRSKEYCPRYMDMKSVDGGLLVQELDEGMEGGEGFEFVTDQKPTQDQLEDLLFAWQIAKNVKSNAIVLALQKKTVGIGAGQMSMVDAVKIAIEKAGEKSKGAVLASDAFFPFEDAVELAVKSGVRAFIQPGGSVRDKQVIDFCNKNKIAMIFTGKRHFKH
ncbi:MAG: bifunctional phosphoribosylaminoimidazolecarboxamide formyltransferase/IMP cyclohydrolase [Candidatus Atribacteria bacterium]|nr:bifunctional phosphoribosylaminoimidazolecarboxamide formyltransferase/IMP cyclohydrolase [Candidatus Atribacteria bacterium]